MWKSLNRFFFFFVVFVARSCVHVYTAKGQTTLKVIRQKTTKSVIVYFNHHSTLWFYIHLETVRGKTKQTNKTKTSAAGLLPEVDLLYVSLYLCGQSSGCSAMLGNLNCPPLSQHDLLWPVHYADPTHTEEKRVQTERKAFRRWQDSERRPSTDLLVSTSDRGTRGRTHAKMKLTQTIRY